MSLQHFGLSVDGFICAILILSSAKEVKTPIARDTLN